MSGHSTQPMSPVQKMFIYVLQAFTPETDDFVEAGAFVRPIYTPKDEATEEILEEFLASIGLPSEERYRNAMASVVVAYRATERKRSNLIASPGNANYYAKTGYSYPVAMRVRDALIEHGHLYRVSRQAQGQSVVFEVSGLNLDGRYQSHIPWPVRAREKKRPGAERGHTLTRDECLRRFGSEYRDAERRMERLNQVYGSHPLTSSDGTAWGGAYRIFNNGRLDRGGRLYGSCN